MNILSVSSGLYFIILHVRMPSILTSCIPNNAGTSPGTSKNLHNSFLCLIVTLYTLNCVILVLLYVHNITCTPLCFTYSHYSLRK